MLLDRLLAPVLVRTRNVLDDCVDGVHGSVGIVNDSFAVRSRRDPVGSGLGDVSNGRWSPTPRDFVASSRSCFLSALAHAMGCCRVGSTWDVTLASVRKSKPDSPSALARAAAFSSCMHTTRFAACCSTPMAHTLQSDERTPSWSHT